MIDGENGDLGKRGYIVPAYGDLRIEGFRTSQSDVATFRFSSVGGSYAGKKGKARNVGVIAVALFEEQAPPEIIEQEVVISGDYPPPPRARRTRVRTAIATARRRPTRPEAPRWIAAPSPWPRLPPPPAPGPHHAGAVSAAQPDAAAPAA